MLVRQTHVLPAKYERCEREPGDLRYTDTRFDEQTREISAKCSPMSLVLPAMSGKSYLVNMIDTPGQVNFFDETIAALRLCDGVVVVVDAVEGLQCQTQRALEHAIRERVSLLLVINKFDRLITKLRLPPQDAYFKSHRIIQEVNNALSKCGYEGESSSRHCHDIKRNVGPDTTTQKAE
mmetsp:Transcript_26330/g.43260  ORF Transcript_26330/g.43260 Transcript_26330/m.43260 type:complete len:179 (+) Transcript_26330:274-810(+)